MHVKTWLPKRSQWWLSVPPKVVKNGLYQPVFGHFILKIQDGGCYAELVLQTEPLVFLQLMGHQWDANEPLLSHIASCGTVLGAILCQKNQPFPP